MIFWSHPQRHAGTSLPPPTDQSDQVLSPILGCHGDDRLNQTQLANQDRFMKRESRSWLGGFCFVFSRIEKICYIHTAERLSECHTADLLVGALYKVSSAQSYVCWMRLVWDLYSKTSQWSRVNEDKADWAHIFGVARGGLSWEQLIGGIAGRGNICVSAIWQHGYDVHGWGVPVLLLPSVWL